MHFRVKLLTREGNARSHGRVVVVQEPKPLLRIERFNLGTRCLTEWAGSVDIYLDLALVFHLLYLIR